MQEYNQSCFQDVIPSEVEILVYSTPPRILLLTLFQLRVSNRYNRAPTIYHGTGRKSPPAIPYTWGFANFNIRESIKYITLFFPKPLPSFGTLQEPTLLNDRAEAGDSTIISIIGRFSKRRKVSIFCRVILFALKIKF